MPLTSAEIRSRFLSFFEERGHRVLPSSALIPGNDPTLLFTNAGMVQFKDVFTGAEARPYTRAATSQKCVRAGGKHNDLESVGATARHHTFFEMLGNFSFGDYFKRDAIAFAWELLTGVFGLDKTRLYATVFREDDEAAAIWEKEIGVPRERILRLGEKDNFWQMGDTGPCGPCSELLYDQGAALSCGKPTCAPGCDCDRYLEIWNLVFMQFERDGSGKMTPLPKPSIDTGMGLERITAVLQGVHSNYDTDLLKPLCLMAGELAGKKYTSVHGRVGAADTGNDDDTSMRVIADHARATAFLIADGVIPSNEGRGYVLRRIMRRAIRHGERLGITRPFFHEVVGRVIELMGGTYPELRAQKAAVLGATTQEEERFRATLRQGLRLLGEAIERIRKDGGRAVGGETAFTLYDTYGFPLDLTEVIAREHGLTVDNADFERRMDEQRTRGGWKGAEGQEIADVYRKLVVQVGATEFTGYSELDGEGRVLAILRDGKLVEEAEGPADIEVVVNRTPFYGESGGQVGDTGMAELHNGHFDIKEVVKPAAGLFVHRGRLERGKLNVGDAIDLKVDAERRSVIKRMHSATHLLHSALRKVLGTHVRQAGSLVDPAHLRFDFAHFSPVAAAEEKNIEELVNEWVSHDWPVRTAEMPMDEAVRRGALAFFGDKYGADVRVLEMGPVSMELCGGTHVQSTGEIGFFKLLREEGVAAGVRRVEATTGAEALKHVHAIEDELQRAAELLKGSPTDVASRVEKLRDREKELMREVEELRAKLAASKSADLVSQAREIGGVKVLATRVEIGDPKQLRDMADKLRDRLKSGIIALGAQGGDGKAILLVAVTSDLTGRFHAGKLVGEAAAEVGGRGGGKPDLAQAGGPDASKLGAALERVLRAVEAQAQAAARA